MNFFFRARKIYLKTRAKHKINSFIFDLQSANTLSKGTKFCLSEQKNKEFLLFFLLFLPQGIIPFLSACKQFCHFLIIIF